MGKIKFHILFWVLIVCLVFHFAFSPFKLIMDLPLHGYYNKPKSIPLNVSNFFNGSFQDSTAKTLKYSFGLFPGFTRIHHQLEYSLFNKVFVTDVYKGSNDFLFRHCKGCMNNNKFDTITINNFVNKYLKLKEDFDSKGKPIIWIFAPDKNMIYLEYLDTQAPVLVNGYYWDLRKRLHNNNIPYIDFNQLAFEEKYSHPFAIFNKGGVHWSLAYASRCFDSLCTYLSKNTSIHIKNTISYNKEHVPWDPDYDIENAANLLVKLEGKENKYTPKIVFDSNAKDKKLLLVGDSFSHAWMWTRWMEKCFSSESEFWYYNRLAYKMNNDLIRNIDHKNVNEYIQKFDLILILYTAENSERLASGFFDDVYSN